MPRRKRQRKKKRREGRKGGGESKKWRPRGISGGQGEDGGERGGEKITIINTITTIRHQNWCHSAPAAPYRNAVVVCISNHLIFHFLPAFEGLVNDQLLGVGQCLLCQTAQLLFVARKTRTKTPQRKCCSSHDRIFQIFCSIQSLLTNFQNGLLWFIYSGD